MNHIVSMIGKQFGRLTVISRNGTNGKEALWKCLCVCGNFHTTRGTRLRIGYCKSCGCLYKDNKPNLIHGFTYSPTWAVWRGMRERCLNKNFKAYRNYGERGITICKRWSKFQNFLDDMGKRPKGKSIDRIDNFGNYSPENCRWATWYEQQNNRRNNIHITFHGETLTLMQWARKLKLNYVTLWRRLNIYKWSSEKTFSFPIRFRQTQSQHEPHC